MMLVKEGQITTDPWLLIEEGDARPGTIAPLAAWRKAPDGAGVWVDGDTEVEEVAEEILPAPVVAVRFGAFADGRGLSLGSLLRSRYGYQGELRAFGDIVPDLTAYMLRCGFNAFTLADQREAEVAAACMARMSGHYQASVREPLPPFRRRSESALGTKG